MRCAARAGGNATQNVNLLNNIIWTQAGYDINVSNDSQQGFSSNYNLLETTGTGDIGYWQTAFAGCDWQVTHRAGQPSGRSGIRQRTGTGDGILGLTHDPESTAARTAASAFQQP